MPRYPLQSAAAAHAVARPELVQTTLTTGRGRTLYCGLRQPIIDPGEISARSLQALSDDELRSMLGDLDVSMGASRASARARLMQTDAQALLLRAGDPAAIYQADTINSRIREVRARETAAVALATDPEKLQSALDGSTVSVSLFCISIISQKDLWAARVQESAFGGLHRRRVVNLPVRGPNGEPRTVLAAIHVRQFVLWMDKEPPCRSDNLFLLEQQGDTARLLEACDRMSLEAACGVDAAVVRVSTPFRGLRKLERDCVENSRLLGPEHPISREQARTLLRKKQEARISDREIAAVVRTGSQLQHMWAPLRQWPTGPEPCRQAVLRLAMMARLVGETPVLCCNSARYAERCDREIQLLATALDSCENSEEVQSIDIDLEFWSPAAHGAFAQ